MIFQKQIKGKTVSSIVPLYRTRLGFTVSLPLLLASPVVAPLEEPQQRVFGVGPDELDALLEVFMVVRCGIRYMDNPEIAKQLLRNQIRIARARQGSTVAAREENLPTPDVSPSACALRRVVRSDANLVASIELEDRHSPQIFQWAGRFRRRLPPVDVWWRRL